MVPRRPAGSPRRRLPQRPSRAPDRRARAAGEMHMGGARAARARVAQWRDASGAASESRQKGNGEGEMPRRPQRGLARRDLGGDCVQNNMFVGLRSHWHTLKPSHGLAPCACMWVCVGGLRAACVLVCCLLSRAVWFRHRHSEIRGVVQVHCRIGAPFAIVSHRGLLIRGLGGITVVCASRFG